VHLRPGAIRVEVDWVRAVRSDDRVGLSARDGGVVLKKWEVEVVLGREG